MSDGQRFRGRSSFDFLRKHPALAAFRRISKAKLNVGDNEEDRSHSQPESAIRQQDSLQRNKLHIALKRRPVTGDAVNRVSAQGISQCRGHADIQIGGELVNGEIANQHQHGGNVYRQHLPRQSSQSEENGSGK